MPEVGGGEHLSYRSRQKQNKIGKICYLDLPKILGKIIYLLFLK